MKDEGKERTSWKTAVSGALRRHAGTAAFVVTAVVLAAGWLAADLTGAKPLAVMVLPPLVGGFCGLCVARKWTAWLIAMVLGLAVGLTAAMQLFFGPPFAGQFRIGFLTVAFYAVLGFIFGAVAELIRFLHRLTHDVAVKLPSRGK